MVKYALQILVEMENIEKIRVDPESHNWWLGLTCTQCRENNDKIHSLSMSDSQPTRTGRGCVHYLAKCKFCSQENTIEILDGSIREYLDGDQFSTIVVFDCRGVEPYKFEFREDWIIKAKDSSAEFTEVDLSSGEWVEWDENAKQEVVIYKLQCKFVKV